MNTQKSNKYLSNLINKIDTEITLIKNGDTSVRNFKSYGVDCFYKFEYFNFLIKNVNSLKNCFVKLGFDNSIYIPLFNANNRIKDGDFSNKNLAIECLNSLKNYLISLN